MGVWLEFPPGLGAKKKEKRHKTPIPISCFLSCIQESARWPRRTALPILYHRVENQSAEKGLRRTKPLRASRGEGRPTSQFARGGAFRSFNMFSGGGVLEIRVFSDGNSSNPLRYDSRRLLKQRSLLLLQSSARWFCEPKANFMFAIYWKG